MAYCSCYRCGKRASYTCSACGEPVCSEACYREGWKAHQLTCSVHLDHMFGIRDDMVADGPLPRGIKYALIALIADKGGGERSQIALAARGLERLNFFTVAHPLDLKDVTKKYRSYVHVNPRSLVLVPDIMENDRPLAERFKSATDELVYNPNMLHALIKAAHRQYEKTKHVVKYYEPPN